MIVVDMLEDDLVDVVVSIDGGEYGKGVCLKTKSEVEVVVLSDSDAGARSLVELSEWLKEVAVDPLNVHLSRGGYRKQIEEVGVRRNEGGVEGTRILNQVIQEGNSDLDLSREKVIGQHFKVLSTDSAIPCKVKNGKQNNQILRTPQISKRPLEFDARISRKRVSKVPPFQSHKQDSSSSSGDKVSELGDFISDSISPSLSATVKEPLHISSKFLKCGRVLPTDQTRWIDQFELELSPLDYDKPITAPVMSNYEEPVRAVMPVGQNFQVEIPERVGLPTRYHSYENKKYIGTNLWRPTSRELVLNRDVQLGGPNVCLCRSPGSSWCIQNHVKQERLLLQTALGPAFSTMGFDDMGEGVLKSWTEDEQESFNKIVMETAGQKKKGFLKPAMRKFPNKSRADIVSYYFNVFVVERMSRQTRDQLVEVDSDDDQPGKSKAATSKYLTPR